MNTALLTVIGTAIVIIPAVLAIVSWLADRSNFGISTKDTQENEEHRLREMKEIICAYEHKEIDSHQFDVAMQYVVDKWRA